MLSLFRIASLGVLVTTAVGAQPAISLVVNAASYARTPLDPSTGASLGSNVIAQGSAFTIFGTNLGPNTIIRGPDSLPIPLSLPQQNGTTISVTSGGRTLSAFPFSNGAGVQVSAILPSSTPLGSATITLTYNGRSSAAAKVTVVKSAPGIYTLNAQGTGPVVAQINNSPAYALLTNSVQPGQTLVLYGTGLGPISGADNVRPGAIEIPNVTVNVAGTTIQPAYAGRSPDFPGLDQINVVIPANAPLGCYVPLEVTSSGQPSNLVYISIASGSATCTHPFGLPAAALAKLDSGGTVNVGTFEIVRAIASGIPIEGGGGLFSTVNADGVFQLYNRIPNAFGAINYPVAAGSCAVLDTLDVGSGALLPDFSTIGGKELSAGASVGVTGPNGTAQSLLAMAAGGYLNFLTNLGAGSWTLSGTRGPDIGAFSGKIDLPNNLVWTNAGNLTTPARSDLTIAWTGGVLNASSLVTIFGSSIVINPGDPSKSRGKQFYCNAPASAGQFVVPTAVLSQLPSSSVDTSAGEVAFGTLGINSGASSTFGAPLVAGGNIDGGFLSYGEAHTINVKYR